MAIIWHASKLVMAFLIAEAFGQCPQENIVIGPGGTFSGKVEVGGEGGAQQYVLLDDNPDRPGSTGIHFLAGCTGNEGQAGQEVVLRLANGALAFAFVLQQDPGRLDSKILQLKPDVGYADLLALPKSFDITVEACSPSADDCLPENSASKLCSISIDIFNVHPPKFSRPFGHGNLDLSSCSGGSNCNLPVVLENQITANDGDGGQVGIVFTHDRFTPNAALFSTSKGFNSELVLTYVGTSSSFSSEDTQVVLMVQATEQRPDALVSTIPLVVTVSGVTTTTTTEVPGGACDKELGRKYFISMVVLGACLGGLLTALFLILLCLCCKRICGLCGGSGSTDFAASSTNVSMRQSGVMAEGAAFRSFKDTTYLTLQEQHSPIGSTTDSPRVSYEPRTRYSDSDSTASADGGWRRRSKN